jgi:mannosyltransferase OCH1-like enzyme
MATIALVVACFTIDARYGLVAVFVAILLGYAFSGDRRNQESLDNSIADSIKTIDATIAEKNRGETAVETIPNTIVQIWVQKDPTNPVNIPTKEQNYSAQIRKMNPDFNYLFFNETDVEPFFTKNYPEYYSTYQRLPLFIQKMDFFRYLIMYHYGGFYFDMDVWALAPIDDKIRNHSAVFPVDEYIVGKMARMPRFTEFAQKDQLFLLGQYAFGSVARHPFLKRVIDQIHTNIDVYIKTVNNSETYVYKTTGPDFVTKVYTEYENPTAMFILANGKRQMFGNYARHDYSGNWKPQWKINAP